MKRKKIINPIIKDTARFLITSSESAGSITELEIELYPGGGNALHVHRHFSETFISVQGELMIKGSGGKSWKLKPCEKFTVPQGMPHCFYNPGKEVIIFRIQIRPGHTGFEQFIHILYGMAAAGKTNEKGLPRELMTLALMMDMGDTHLTGWKGRILGPILKWMAAKARRNGLEKRLLAEYWSRENYVPLLKAAS